MTNEMTAEEAIRQIKENCYFASISEKTKQALDMAIQALEQQPCEDCISRRAVLDTIGNVPDYDDGMVWEALSHAQRDVALLPPVTPQRPKGKWIEMLEHRDEFGSTWHYECSECRAKSYKGFKPLEKYCPNCGADMRGENNGNMD